MNDFKLALLLTFTLPLSAGAAITTIHKDFKTGAGTALSARSINGDIAISTGAAGAVTADITYEMENCEVTAQLRGKTVYFEAKNTKTWKLFSFGGSNAAPCATFVIKAPAGMEVNAVSVSGGVAADLGGPVTGKTVSGGATITGPSSLSFTTVSGSLEFSGASGKLRMNTTSGGITGTVKSSQDLEARSISGRIALEILNTPQKGAYSLETVSGALELTFPKGAKAAATLHSVSGGQKNNIINDPAAAFKITAKTISGDLTINGK